MLRTTNPWRHLVLQKYHLNSIKRNFKIFKSSHFNFYTRKKFRVKNKNKNYVYYTTSLTVTNTKAYSSVCIFQTEFKEWHCFYTLELHVKNYNENTDFLISLRLAPFMFICPVYFNNEKNTWLNLFVDLLHIWLCSSQAALNWVIKSGEIHCL